CLIIFEIRQAQKQKHSKTLMQMMLCMKRPTEGDFHVSKGWLQPERRETNQEQDAQKNSILSNSKLQLMKIQPALLEN
ncbi:hypothetical protein ACTXT7_005321, partial [Hymenolepis weldensis]